MNNLTTKLIKKLFFNDKNSELFDAALNELLRQELEESVNDILKYELDSFLNYDRYQRSDNPNSRIGYYKRTMKSSYGELNLKDSKRQACQVLYFASSKERPDQR